MRSASHVACWSLTLQELQNMYNGSDPIPEPGVVTLMVRNVPRSYNHEVLLEEIDTLAPKGSYDFIHLPWDCRRHTSITFAFVNFVDPEAALRCFFALSGHVWQFAPTAKPCRIVPAHVQGLVGNLTRFMSNSGGKEADSQTPILFHNGKRIGASDLRSVKPSTCGVRDVMLDVKLAFHKQFHMISQSEFLQWTEPMKIDGRCLLNIDLSHGKAGTDGRRHANFDEAPTSPQTILREAPILMGYAGEKSICSGGELGSPRMVKLLSNSMPTMSLPYSCDKSASSPAAGDVPMPQAWLKAWLH